MLRKYLNFTLYFFPYKQKKSKLRIDRIDEKPNKTWDECEARVQKLIEVNLGITDTIESERCHRISAQTKSSKNQNRSRTILCKVIKFKDKQKILKYAKCLKNKGIFIYKNFVRTQWIYEKNYGTKYQNIAKNINLRT